MHNAVPKGPVYAAAFATTAATASSHDVFGILPSTNTRVCIHEILVALPTTDFQAERITITVLRGSTASSTGAAITPQHVHGWSGAPTAGSSVTGPSATLVSTTSAVLMHADVFTDHRWCYKPEPNDRLILEQGQRLHVRITAPTTTRLSGVLTFSEIGTQAR